jgi:multidrug resistance efflux pump
MRQDEFRDQVSQAEAALANSKARLQEAVTGARIEDIQQAEAQVAQAEAATVGAKHALSLAQQDYRDVNDLRSRLESAQTNYNTAEQAHQQAQQALALVIKGPRSEEIAQANGLLQQMQALNARAQEDYSRDQILFTKGAIAASRLDATRSAAQAAQAQVAQAQAKLDELEAGSRPEEIRKSEASEKQAAAAAAGAKQVLGISRQQYDQRLSQKTALTNADTLYNTSQEQLRQAQARLRELLAGTRPEQIAQLKAQVSQAQAALSQVQIQLRDTTVVSPIDGRVITRSVEPGELATLGSTLMEVADLNTVWIRVYVEEPDYGRINLGDAASVTVDSYPGETFTGRVTEISQQAEFTPKEIQTNEQRAKLVFGIKITLSNLDGKLKPGMPADAELKLAPLSGEKASSTVPRATSTTHHSVSRS